MAEHKSKTLAGHMNLDVHTTNLQNRVQILSFFIFIQFIFIKRSFI